MGGLSCALSLAKQGFTQISVYEAASNLGFVGAGIQLAPNMARILDRFGVWGDIEKEAVDLKSTSIRRMYARSTCKTLAYKNQREMETSNSVMWICSLFEKPTGTLTW